MNNHPIYPYPDTLVSAAETRKEHTPVTPLPNPGEGGPVYERLRTSHSPAKSRRGRPGL